MPPAARNPFEKWFLDFLKFLIITHYQKFCGGPGGGFLKEPPGRRRQWKY